MKNVDRILDEYENKIGLSKYEDDINDNGAQKYLSLSREEMERLDLEDCAEISVVLNSLAYHIQRCHNRETSRVFWANSQLKQLVSGKETQFSGSWESQYNQAIQSDDYTRKLYSIYQHAKQRAERLSFLANSIKSVGESFVNLQRAKGMK